ncbi:hypothetical protein [Methanolobus chelungpuianus]|uniref:Uncharacterized protein n=1 Tax=Methanolobus chelungpuianus TaxID=502115 RepID=A0AAE3HDH4_9EURY|nr:hypothetical protein [Methanolobus chelungpuianus]MCQ6963879.1 hypothetical protein [Methanolobus chelungpuianus]
MKKINSLIIALMVVLLTIASASAVANEKMITGTQTIVAFSGNTSDGLSDVNIVSFQTDYMGNKETKINFDYTIYDENGAVIEEYSTEFIPIDNSCLIVNQGLKSATLSIPKLTVNDSDDNQFDVSVNLRWDGNKVLKIPDNKPPVTVNYDFVQIILVKGTEATLKGSIEGEDISINAGAFTPYDTGMGYKSSIIAQMTFRSLYIG